MALLQRTPYGQGSPARCIREVPKMKARVFRALVTVAMLAAVVQSLGAAVKW
jgi:hypothetical protein